MTGFEKALLEELAAIPWIDDASAQGSASAIGADHDTALRELKDAVLMREPLLAPSDALVHLGRDRLILRAPVEGHAQYGPRLDKVNARTEDAQRRAAEARQRISAAVRAASPAGIRARTEFQATPHLKLDASLELGDLRLDDRGKARVAAELTEAVVQAARSLPPGSTVRRQKLVAPLLTHPSVAGQHPSVRARRDARGRAPLAAGDLYIGPLEAVKLDAADVTLTWFRRPTLAVELGVKKAGSADITRVAVREAVEQYNAHVRSGGKINLLFDDLKQQLGAGIELTSLTAFRDNAAQTELASDPPDKRTIKLKTDETLELKDTETTA